MGKFSHIIRTGAALAALAGLVAGCGTPPSGAPMGNVLPSLTQLPVSQVESFAVPTQESWVADAPNLWRAGDGRYVARTTGDVATASLTFSNLLSNVFVEVDYVRDPGSVGAGGIVARATPDFKAWEAGSGYLFGVGSDGEGWQASIIRQTYGEVGYVLAWTNISAFAGESNHIVVLLSGRLLQFYVNGVLFWEGLDRGPDSGGVGLFASTPEGFGATHEFSSFVVKNAEPSAVSPTIGGEPVKTPPAAKSKKEEKSSPKADKKEKSASEADSGAVPAAASVAVAAPAMVPTSSTDSGPDRSPILRPGFLMRVSVLVSGKREIDGEVKRVSDNNMLDLPLIGQIPVEGVSLRRLNEILQERYSEFFVNPQVIAEFVMEERADAISPWGSVVVLGRVRTPGRVNIPPTQDLRLSAAIQLAGGLDTSARASAIRLTRKKDDGTTEQTTVDFTAVGQHGEIGNDLLLRAGDLIFVPERIF